MELPPILPSLLPNLVDPIWFCVDKPCDDENELSKLEIEHKTWVSNGIYLSDKRMLNIVLVIYVNIYGGNIIAPLFVPEQNHVSRKLLHFLS